MSHCIFCSDLFHPKSLPCSVISSIRCIIHPVCPFDQICCSITKEMPDRFFPASHGHPAFFIVSPYRISRLPIFFPFLIVLPVPLLSALFSPAHFVLWEGSTFFLTLSGFVPSVLIYRNFPLYTSGTCSLTPLRSFIGFSGSRASSRYNVHLEKP